MHQTLNKKKKEKISYHIYNLFLRSEYHDLTIRVNINVKTQEKHFIIVNRSEFLTVTI